MRKVLSLDKECMKKLMINCDRREAISSVPHFSSLCQLYLRTKNQIESHLGVFDSHEFINDLPTRDFEQFYIDFDYPEEQADHLNLADQLKHNF